MTLEVERKFLLDELQDWLSECESEGIRQGYVALDGDTEVRVRRYGPRCSLTVKSGGGLVRVEVEVDIDGERFEALWPLTAGRRVSKRRHRVPSDRSSLDVDVYEDELVGLAVAEVEFGSVQESEEFTAPSWLGDEVTADDRYKNRALAENGRPA